MSIDNILSRAEIPYCDSYGVSLTTEERLSLLIKEFYETKKYVQILTNENNELKNKLLQSILDETNHQLN